LAPAFEVFEFVFKKYSGITLMPMK